jgi:hypothetical protein
MLEVVYAASPQRHLGAQATDPDLLGEPSLRAPTARPLKLSHSHPPESIQLNAFASGGLFTKGASSPQNPSRGTKRTYPEHASPCSARAGKGAGETSAGGGYVGDWAVGSPWHQAMGNGMFTHGKQGTFHSSKSCSPQGEGPCLHANPSASAAHVPVKPPHLPTGKKNQPAGSGRRVWFGGRGGDPWSTGAAAPTAPQTDRHEWPAAHHHRVRWDCQATRMQHSLGTDPITRTGHGNNTRLQQPARTYLPPNYHHPHVPVLHYPDRRLRLRL